MMSRNYFLTSKKKRVFFGAGMVLLLSFSLCSFQLTPAFFISPVPTNSSVIEVIRPQLEKYKNTFLLKTHTSFIQSAHAGEDFEQAKSYAIINLKTGDVLREKALTESVPIASLTKIMTAVVALDLAKPHESFVVTKRASRQPPTKIGVVPGEMMTLEELLEASLLTSANDSAQVLSDGIDAKYHEAVFVRAMNEKASLLGLTHTHFTNPQGFDSTHHYSSAGDLAVLSQYALTHYPLLASIVRKDYLFLPKNESHKQFDLYNWNGLLGVYPNVSGIKIGNTDDAGKTMIVVSEREGAAIMVVLLGAPGILERDIWASQLLDIGFAETIGLPPVQVTEEALREKYATWEYVHE